MADTRQDRKARMATALRENLKRRKAQRRDVAMDENVNPAKQRLFREKPLKPDKNQDGSTE